MHNTFEDRPSTGLVTYICRVYFIRFRSLLSILISSRHWLLSPSGSLTQRQNKSTTPALRFRYVFVPIATPPDPRPLVSIKALIHTLRIVKLSGSPRSDQQSYRTLCSYASNRNEECSRRCWIFINDYSVQSPYHLSVWCHLCGAILFCCFVSAQVCPGQTVWDMIGTLV